VSSSRTVHVHDPIAGATFPLVGDADDFGVIGAIAREDGRYEQALLQVAGAALHPGAVCLDIGANIGFFSVFLGRHCPRGRVIAFEPSRANVAHLRRNLALNALSNVEVEPIGVYDRTGVLELHYTSKHPGGSFFAESAIDAGELESIEVTSIDEWAERVGLERLDLVKLDVEGSELRVLRGAEKTLRRFKPALFVECNPISLRRFQGAAPGELVGLLRSIYGSVRHLRDGGLHYPLRGDRHLEHELGREGVLELACGIGRLSRPRWNRSFKRRLKGTRPIAALMDLTGLGTRAPPDFVHDPHFDGRFEVNNLVVPAGSLVTVPVVFRNLGALWWNPAMDHSPVTIGHRWLFPDGTPVDDGDGVRTLLPRAIGPGRSLRTTIVARAPLQPGGYALRATPVQESYVWFDELRPEMTATIHVNVT
jgi:FkbM family methyltransferase